MSYGGISVKGIGASGFGGTIKHNNREKVARDRKDEIDKTRTSMNEILFKTDGQEERIEKAIVETEKYNGRKMVRKGKNARKVLVTFVAHASGDFFFNVDSDDWNTLDPGKSFDKIVINQIYRKRLNAERLKEWKLRVLRFAKREFGDNLLQVNLHMDEKTPHIHIDMIPWKDGRLNKRELYSYKKFLEMKERYNKEVNIPMHLKMRGPNTKQGSVDVRLYKVLMRAGIKKENYKPIISALSKKPLRQAFEALGIDEDNNDVEPVGKDKNKIDLLKKYFRTDLVGLVKRVQEAQEGDIERQGGDIESDKER